MDSLESYTTVVNEDYVVYGGVDTPWTCNPRSHVVSVPANATSLSTPLRGSWMASLSTYLVSGGLIVVTILAAYGLAVYSFQALVDEVNYRELVCPVVVTLVYCFALVLALVVEFPIIMLDLAPVCGVVTVDPWFSVDSTLYMYVRPKSAVLLQFEHPMLVASVVGTYTVMRLCESGVWERERGACKLAPHVVVCVSVRWPVGK